jgi:CRISPR-associated protein Cas2
MEVNNVYIIIAYDISVTSSDGQKRLRDIAKYCQNIGQRVQNSVFECVIDYAQYVKIINDISKLIDTSSDSIRIYNLGNKWVNNVIHIGVKDNFDIEKGSIIL